MPRYVWGVDSAAVVTDDLYSCVRTSFGNPKFWGRYLSEEPNVTEGLTKKEIAFIRSKGIKVLPIYKVYRASEGYSNGQIAARNAVYNARRLGIPNNVALFANIEGFFDVDESWIRGWIESIYSTGYRSGIYNDPVKGNFSIAYCEAGSNNNMIFEQSILWSVEPATGVTKERNSPRYNPKKPGCKANVWLWQYGHDAELCPIDTNLADSRILEYLF